MAREKFCINHPDVPAEIICRQCHKPICKDCVKSDAGGQFCSFQCSENYKDFQARQGGETKKKGGVLGKIIILIILLAVAVFVGAKCFGIGFCEDILKLIGLGKAASGK